MTAHTDNYRKAVILAITAVFLANIQDAIVKYVSGAYPAYEAMLFRGLASTPILAAILLWRGNVASLKTPFLGWLALRGLMLASAYLGFIMAIASMPIANALVIYFTMPFILAALSKPFLGERVPPHRWVAMVAAFVGVLVMVRPGAAPFEPASLFALWSAFGYAVGQMMGRHVAGKVPAITVANIQNVVYLAVGAVLLLIFGVYDFSQGAPQSLAFLVRPFLWPTTTDLFFMLAMGLLSCIAMICFITAYTHAPANYVAPFEYTGMVWAVLFGVLVFGDVPDMPTWMGIAIVVSAGLWMLWMDGRVKTVASQSTG